MTNFDPKAIEREIVRASRFGQLAIVRAHRLMAYGVNASKSADADYSLQGFIRYEDDLEPLEGGLRISFQEMFQSWTVGNGFRDMLEGLATTLDGVYTVLINCKGHIQGQTPKFIEKKFVRPFMKRGVTEKLDALQRDFGIVVDTTDHLESIVRARNSLTHRFGMVGPEDCDNGEGHLTITWRSLDMSLMRTDGSIEKIDRNRIGPVPHTVDDELIYGMIAASLHFKIGDEIRIPPRVLEEIAVMMRFTVGAIHQLAINWLIDNGIKVHGGMKINPPTVSLEVTLAPHNNTA